MFKSVLPLFGVAFLLAMCSSDDTSTTAVPVEQVREAVAARPSAAAVGNGFGEVVLTREADGHFYTNAMVGGATIRFLVDTGASSVALTREDAQAAGVQFATGDFTGTGATAGGKVALKHVKLDRVAVGTLEARNVDAVIVDADMGVSLLGQNWLSRVGTVTIQGDRMVLR